MKVIPVPSFIRNSNIGDRGVNFRWDEWNNEVADAPADEDLTKRFENLSYRSNLAFIIVSAGWVIRRFDSLVDQAVPYQCLEAAWLQQIHFLYSWDWEIDRDWTGPVKGPIRLALDKVTWAVQETRDYRHPAWAAATISKLAEYVLTDPSQYIRWRTEIFSHLKKLYEFDADDQLGDVVPPQALDPDYLFKPIETEERMNEMLRNADYRSNQFLNSPEVMLELGFEGTPYVFNMLEDRKRRIEW